MSSVSENAKPAGGMHLFLLDNSGILFSESRQEIHSLNSSATAIWCLLEDGKNRKEMVSELAKIFSLDLPRAELFVSKTLEDWRQTGFLADSSSSIEAGAPGDPGEQDTSDLPDWAHNPFVAERFYHLQNSCLHFRFTKSEQETVVHPILAHLEREPDSKLPQTPIDIIAVKQEIVLYRDKNPVASCRKIDELAPLAKGLVWATVLRDHQFFLDIHAGVVGNEEGCILLVAPPGGGKSTLTSALVHTGFQYFSDEVALLEEGSFNVFPFPLALCFKDTGIEAASEFFPEVKTLPIHNRGDGKRVCYLPPPAHTLPTGTHAHPVKAVIFPLYQPNASGIFERMDNMETLKQLMEECIVIDRHLDKQTVARLVEWVSQVDSYRLVYSSTEQAISRINSI